jgi:hypothetical protein
MDTRYDIEYLSVDQEDYDYDYDANVSASNRNESGETVIMTEYFNGNEIEPTATDLILNDYKSSKLKNEQTMSKQQSSGINLAKRNNLKLIKSDSQSNIKLIKSQMKQYPSVETSGIDGVSVLINQPRNSLLRRTISDTKASKSSLINSSSADLKRMPLNSKTQSHAQNETGTIVLSNNENFDEQKQEENGDDDLNDGNLNMSMAANRRLIKQQQQELEHLRQKQIKNLTRQQFEYQQNRYQFSTSPTQIKTGSRTSLEPKSNNHIDNSKLLPKLNTGYFGSI